MDLKTANRKQEWLQFADVYSPWGLLQDSTELRLCGLIPSYFALLKEMREKWRTGPITI